MARKRIFTTLILLAVLMAGSLVTPFRTRVSAAPAAAGPVRDTLRFSAQVGAAAYLFYELVYKPYTNHAFDKGANGRAAAIAKAAASLALCAADLKNAYDLAKKSDSKVLKALVPYLEKLQPQVQSAADKLKSEATTKAQNAKETYLQQIKSSFDAFLAAAKQKGLTIKEKKS
jgi:hypothetical protein